MPGGTETYSNFRTTKNNSRKQWNAVEIQNKPKKNKLVSISLILHNVVYVSLFMTEAQNDVHTLIKLHFSWFLTSFFLSRRGTDLFLCPTKKSACIFLWVIMIVHCTTKVNLWYARHMIPRHEKWCPLLFGPLFEFMTPSRTALQSISM